MSDYVSEDTVLQIFKSLPVKTLLRFRCVCKLWKQLIDSPTFMLGHLALQKPGFLVEHVEPGLLVVDPHTKPPLVNTIRCSELPNGTQEFTLLGTLHGVVCLYDNLRNVLLWNPSIRKLSSLPPVPLGPDWGDRGQMLACRGFWIDPSTKEFKIVLLSHHINGWLYSSIRQRWIRIPRGELANRLPYPDDPAVVIGGVAHWIGQHFYRDDHGVSHVDRFILAFDFTLESYEFIEMTGLESYPILPCCWKGMLSVLCVGSVIHSRQEGSWVKMFGFNLDVPILRVLYPMEAMEGSGRVLAMIRDEIKTGEGEPGRVRNDLVLYDTKTGCIVLKSGIHSRRDSCYPFSISYDFVESLLFP